MLNANDFSKKQIIFLFTNEGEKLSFSNDNIIVKDKEGKIKHQSTCYRLFMVCVVGNISITSGLIQRSKKFGFSICLMTTTFRVYDVIDIQNYFLKKYALNKDDQFINELIYLSSDNIWIKYFKKCIEKNKIKNQANTLRMIRSKSEFVKEGISLLDEFAERLDENAEYLEIMGIEGSAARVYFPRVFSNVNWKGRKPRIKNDYINTTLDIGYTMLFNIVDAILQVYGFDTYYGVFHKCFYMRKSLVCDIMEPMRPIIDYQVRKAINLEQCKVEDFDVYNNRWVLKYKNSPEYVKFLMKAILDYKEEIFVYIQSYYRYFMKRKSVSELPKFDV